MVKPLESANSLEPAEAVCPVASGPGGAPRAGAARLMPPGPRLPRLVQGAAFWVDYRRTLIALQRRYGAAFTAYWPPIGELLVITDPVLVKELFTTSPELVGVSRPSLDRVLGERSIFGLDGREHRQRRRIVTPTLRGKRLNDYESLIEAETLREIRTWPVGEEFATTDRFARLALDVIIRVVFGADGAEFDELRRLMPKMVKTGLFLAYLPVPERGLGPVNPWRRLRRLRARYDEIVSDLITAAVADPALAERADLLSTLLRARDADGHALTREDLADELLTLLVAGHETTANQLSWCLERLRRHPAFLERLVADLDAGGTELLRATILEVQRTRAVIVSTERRVLAPQVQIGPWVVPQGSNVMVAIDLIHRDESIYPDAQRFDPYRFVGADPATFAWLSFGGGARRCIGAAFADLEMQVVLRTLLRELELVTTDEPDESWKPRGITYAPGRGGRIAVRPRSGR